MLSYRKIQYLYRLRSILLKKMLYLTAKKNIMGMICKSNQGKCREKDPADCEAKLWENILEQMVFAARQTVY